MKPVTSIVRGTDPHWVGDGFPVRTFFSYDRGAAFSPFLLLDYAGPAEFAPARSPRGVGPHPHRGFETVTLCYQGEVAHRDYAGHSGRIGADDVQWMTAGSGVVHEEMHGPEFTRTGGTLEMVQLWINLPAKLKMTPPRYQRLLDVEIPRVELPEDAGTVRVIAGTFGRATGPAHTFTPIEVLDLRVRAGRSVVLPLPKGHTGMALVQQGSVRVNQNDEVKTREMAVFGGAGDRLTVEARSADARVLVLAGEPIDEPVVGYGPFVMNTEAEISAAIADFQQGRMGRM